MSVNKGLRARGAVPRPPQVPVVAGVRVSGQFYTMPRVPMLPVGHHVTLGGTQPVKLLHDVLPATLADDRATRDQTPDSILVELTLVDVDVVIGEHLLAEMAIANLHTTLPHRRTWNPTP